ncbi:MAG: cytochrome c3 family protein [Sandaracinaceae bacterium]|nr:cytochrome c3 family protein [Sandaracinaceae bacterium]
MRNLLPLVALLLLAAPSAVARAQAACVACHRANVEPRLRMPVAMVAADAHGRAGVECVSCHGGDPDAPGAEAHDLAAGFVGRPGEVGSARVCGRCHDGSTEAPDVLEAYRVGRHARALAEGRTGAGCSGCHGGHGIGASDDARARVVGVCGACHSDEARMEASGLPTNQAQQWAHSVHGAAVARGSEDAPVCASCHDPHANEAGLGAVAACGRCHEEARAAFDRGPHHDHYTPLGFLDCVECHGSHAIQPASGALLAGLDSVCLRCHGHEQPLFDDVRRIATLGPAIDQVRADAERDDPVRREVIAALHALDVVALEEALDGVVVAPAPPEPAATTLRTRPRPAPPVVSIVLTALVLLTALGLFGWAVSIWRRR